MVHLHVLRKQPRRMYRFVVSVLRPATLRTSYSHNLFANANHSNIYTVAGRKHFVHSFYRRIELISGAKWFMLTSRRRRRRYTRLYLIVYGPTAARNLFISAIVLTLINGMLWRHATFEMSPMSSAVDSDGGWGDFSGSIRANAGSATQRQANRSPIANARNSGECIVHRSTVRWMHSSVWRQTRRRWHYVTPSFTSEESSSRRTSTRPLAGVRLRRDGAFVWCQWTPAYGRGQVGCPVGVAVAYDLSRGRPVTSWWHRRGANIPRSHSDAASPTATRGRLAARRIQTPTTTPTRRNGIGEKAAHFLVKLKRPVGISFSY